jgi:hypothetical protein
LSFEIVQTYLPRISQSVESLLTTFPVLGNSANDLPLFMVQFTVAQHQLFVRTWKVDIAKSPGAVGPPPSG